MVAGSGERSAAAGRPARHPGAPQLDHGVWSPSPLMDPDSELPWCRSPSRPTSPRPSCGNWGEALQGLREQGIGILASGAITHNLRALGPDGSPVPQWASQFARWLEQTMAEGDRGRWKITGPGRRARWNPIPRRSPAPPVCGARRGGGRQTRKLHDSWDYGSLYMGPTSSVEGGAARPSCLTCFSPTRVEK